MNKKTKVLLIALGLVVLMAVPAFASQGTLGNHRFSWGAGRQSNIEIIAEKTGIPVEKLLKERESGSNCKELLERYGLNTEKIREEVREARLDQRLQVVNEKVKAGDITKEEGDTIKKRIQSHRFLQDCNGPHHGEREGMKLNLKRGEGACEYRQGAGGQHKHGAGRQRIYEKGQIFGK
ncbi:MAG: hypothetical protein ACOX0L_02570 [Natronincolaceae bacterium]|nr:DUF2680 domain-containing protein [Bacillota bacterium]NLK90460.1 DUF2680 domain-containing protein [Clostridiales bacterium]